MKKSLLLITSSYDLTCDYIINKFQNIKFFRFNIDKFYDYEITVSKKEFKILSKFHSIMLSNCHAIYYRKPVLPDLNKKISKKYHLFAHKEIFSFVEGIVESFEGNCISKPSILRRANNKILQQIIAEKFNFTMPISKITNSKGEIENKFSKKLIGKPISIGVVDSQRKKEIVQTNLINDNVNLNHLKFCPVYFQEYIEKDYDLRITFVKDSFWPVKIISQNKIDWRKPDNYLKYELIDIPKALIKNCKKMMEFFHLSFGCFDFVVKNGKFYFLEINANGQWAWLEKELNLKISDAIIKSLIKK